MKKPPSKAAVKKNLTSLFDRAMQHPPSGELAGLSLTDLGLRALGQVMTLFILGEGPLPETLREGVGRLLSMTPLELRRSGIPVELATVLWPALNNLQHARANYERSQRSEAEAGGTGLDGGGVVGTVQPLAQVSLPTEERGTN